MITQGEGLILEWFGKCSEFQVSNCVDFPLTFFFFWQKVIAYLSVVLVSVPVSASDTWLSLSCLSHSICQFIEFSKTNILNLFQFKIINLKNFFLYLP